MSKFDMRAEENQEHEDPFCLEEKYSVITHDIDTEN